MRFAKVKSGLLMVMLATSTTGTVESKPTTELARLKVEIGVAWEKLGQGQKPELSAVERNAAGDRRTSAVRTSSRLSRHWSPKSREPQSRADSRKPGYTVLDSPKHFNHYQILD